NSRNLRIVEKRIGKITLAKANRNSSPTYSLVRFAPSHSLRMGDFFRKNVKKAFVTFIVREYSSENGWAFTTNTFDIFEAPLHVLLLFYE
ncbi:hypothetical protein AABM27_11775, partial [Heyndrickxia faecalis]|uniref:hypothetical protein n=1 Tax=Heyndrickxia faecalis TaxID=2824910 RepID=UPI003100B3A6